MVTLQIQIKIKRDSHIRQPMLALDSGFVAEAGKAVAKLFDPVQSKELCGKYLRQEDLVMNTRLRLTAYIGDERLKEEVHVLVDMPINHSTPGSSILFKDRGATESFLKRFHVARISPGALPVLDELR